MRESNHGSAMLMELLMALLMFMLAAPVLLELFAGANRLGRTAGIRSDALAEAQNLAESLYAAEDAQPGAFSIDCGDFCLEAALEGENSGAGTLLRGEIRAVRDGETLLALPWARYLPGEQKP